MGHPELDNRTPFAFAPLFVADEEARPVVATLVRGTFGVDGRGRVTLAAEQEAIAPAGRYCGEPGKSSVIREPETAFTKPGTDCVLQGHAQSRRPVAQLDVGFRIGALTGLLRATGDRRWDHGLFGARSTPPVPFERMPLLWERAFGGWDRTPEADHHHQCDERNPLGVGFVARKGVPLPGAPLPNLEDPRQPLTGQSQRPAPAGFGFTGHQWQPRARYAGTFDSAWEQQRAPRLPRDFDRRYFQAAAPGLASSTPLRGDEPVVVIGATPEGRFEFALPGLPPPVCTVVLRTGDAVALTTALDTVIVDADARRLVLSWRAFTVLPNGPHDVRAITITAPLLPERS